MLKPILQSDLLVANLGSEQMPGIEATEDDFEQDGDGGAGADAAPEPPQPTPAKRPRIALPRRGGLDALVVAESPVKVTLCLLCDGKCYPKSRFCTKHKRDAEACKKDAEASGQEDYFHAQAANIESYRKMILTYSQQCQSRGSGCRRDKFDWTAYQESSFKKREMRKGQSLGLSIMLGFGLFLEDFKRVCSLDSLHGSL